MSRDNEQKAGSKGENKSYEWMKEENLLKYRQETRQKGLEIKQ